MKNITIRQAGNNDIRGIKDIVKEAFDRSGKNEGLSLGSLAVKPSYQRKGIGRRLIDYGLKKAKEIGFESALKYGIVLSNNHPENPYLKIKFLDINREVSGKMRFCDSFYDGNGELL
ncbi:GNAT family N-acetyltransferase [Anaerosalibacter massiliensis]|uniref:GNAT family N-acetyltransferase n=1 Tax=Anaerosalibacter massiliensis TaxID=1347392 RepID=A0A9X2S3M7_9FIRM|nr:GNAT family N-acetyltransferase [Anaerosalibacter massiliensis]MCR2042915.1 GNAT family N-acetyltransferase [Anaerosalibacter massiliensis]